MTGKGKIHVNRTKIFSFFTYHNIALLCIGISQREKKGRHKKACFFWTLSKSSLDPTPLILDIRGVTFVSAHFGQPWGNFWVGPKLKYLPIFWKTSASKLLEHGQPTPSTPIYYPKEGQTRGKQNYLKTFGFRLNLHPFLTMSKRKTVLMSSLIQTSWIREPQTKRLYFTSQLWIELNLRKKMSRTTLLEQDQEKNFLILGPFRCSFCKYP